MNLEQRSTSFDTGEIPESVAAGSWASAAAQERPRLSLEVSDLGSVPESVLLCPGCGWQLATADGYCLDCSPPDEDGDE